MGEVFLEGGGDRAAIMAAARQRHQPMFRQIVKIFLSNYVSSSRQVEYILKVGQSTLTYVSIWFCRQKYGLS